MVGPEVCKLLDGRVARALDDMRWLSSRDAVERLHHEVQNRHWLDVAGLVATHWSVVRVNIGKFAKLVEDLRGACTTDEEREDAAVGVRIVRVAKLCADAHLSKTCCLGFACHPEFDPWCTVSTFLLAWLHREAACTGRRISESAPSCRLPGGTVRVSWTAGAAKVVRAQSAQALILWRALVCGQVVIAAMLLCEFPDIRWCMEPTEEKLMRSIQQVWAENAVLRGDTGLEAFLAAHGIRRNVAPALPPCSPPEVPRVEDAWWADRDPAWTGPFL